MKCDKCNALIDSVDVYCPECGEKINWEKVRQSNASANRGSNKTLVGLVFAFIVMCALAGVYYFLFIYPTVGAGLSNGNLARFTVLMQNAAPFHTS